MEKIPPKIFKATISSVEVVANGTKKLTFKIDEPFSFLVGQYVWIEIPKMKTTDPKGNRRAFSICSVPNKENTISIVTRISGSNYKKSLFSLKKGNNVIIHSPFGSSFILEQNLPKQLIMIAGGVGVAPFLPILETIKIQSLPIKCFLVYLNRNKQSTPFLKELEALKSGNVRFDYSLKYDFFSWNDLKNNLGNFNKNRQWWISGPQAMVDYVYSGLKKNKVPDSEMVFENYYPGAKNKSAIKKIKAHLKKENLLFTALQNSTNHIVITDTNGVILFANKAAERITGYTSSELLGNTPRLWGGVMSQKFYKNLWARKKLGVPFLEKEIVNRRKNGEIYYATAHITQIVDERKKVIGFIANEEDITDIIKIDQVKNEFASLSSHQLRTPLSSMNWYLEMLLAGDAGKLTKEQKKYIDEIYTSNKRMVELVNSLLTVSHLELGNFNIEPTPTIMVP